MLKTIQADLEQKPDRGSMVPGLAGVRKARVANPSRGKGKRGGYRYLYPHLEKKRTFLLILLDKNEQEDATEEQRKQIREWVTQVKEYSGG